MIDRFRKYRDSFDFYDLTITGHEFLKIYL